MLTKIYDLRLIKCTYDEENEENTSTPFCIECRGFLVPWLKSPPPYFPSDDDNDDDDYDIQYVCMDKQCNMFIDHIRSL